MVRTYDIDPADFFGEKAPAAALAGGSPEENAGITRRILEGEKGPQRDVVVLNASAALVAAGAAENLKEGVETAGKAVDEGAAAEKLEALVRFTRENG
jgi:anthranilate phosphoribosyltransferase